MVRDIEERLTFMLLNGVGNYDNVEEIFMIKPIGLNMEQIKRYKLPPNPTKMIDVRTPEYVRKFGKTCWEVDALNPETLVELVTNNIEDNIDNDIYESVLQQEDNDIIDLIIIQDEQTRKI